jgi:hypothetical protein
VPRNLLEAAKALLELENTHQENVPVARAMRNRVISTCYYSVFQATSHIVADRFSPLDGPAFAPRRWSQIFRSLDHRQVVKVARQLLITKQKGEVTIGGKMALEYSVRVWAKNIIDLQQFRHSADYDPFYDPSRAETQSFIALAEDTLLILENLSPEESAELAVSLAFPPRINT